VDGQQALTDESGAPVHTPVEEMAAFYASQIQAIQAEGPYYLTGHSLGGWIAYAVAQELRSKGQQTAFLGMLDTQASSNVGWRVYLKIMLPVLLNRAAFHLKRAWRMPGAERWQYLRNRLKFLTMHLPGVSRPLPSPDEETAMVPDPDGGKMLDYYDAVATVYRPGRYDGSVVVFAGEDVGNFQHERFWRCFVTGDVSFHRVSGDHLSLMSGDNAAVVGEIVRRTLDEADVEAASTR